VIYIEATKSKLCRCRILSCRPTASNSHHFNLTAASLPELCSFYYYWKTVSIAHLSNKVMEQQYR